jgi:hypothetical protein
VQLRDDVLLTGGVGDQPGEVLLLDGARDAHARPERQLAELIDVGGGACTPPPPPTHTKNVILGPKTFLQVQTHCSEYCSYREYF